MAVAMKNGDRCQEAAATAEKQASGKEGKKEEERDGWERERALRLAEVYLLSL